MTTTKTDPLLIDLLLPIETPRLLIRLVQAGDGAEMMAAKQETWADLWQWMIWTRDGVQNAEENEAHVRKAFARATLREDLWMVGVEKASGRQVVWTGLHEPDWQARNFMIGYWVRKSAQGHGYAGEATNALLRYTFGALAANRVAIDHAEGNLASQRTIEKLGFIKEGIARRGSLLPDGWYADTHRYARLDLAGLPPLDVSWGASTVKGGGACLVAAGSLSKSG